MSTLITARSSNTVASSVAALVFAILLAGCASRGTALAEASEPRDTALACTLPSNCVNSLSGSELEPLRFDGSAAQAMVALRTTLAAFPEAKIVMAEGLVMEAVFSTPAGFKDVVDFRIDTPAQRIDFRSRSAFGLFDFGKNRSRMAAFAKRFELNRPR